MLTLESFVYLSIKYREIPFCNSFPGMFKDASFI